MSNLEVGGCEPVLIFQQKDSKLSHNTIQFTTMDDNSSDFSRTSIDRQSPRIDSPFQLDISKRILDIIFEYALNKFDDSEHRMAAGTAKFLSVINQFVLAGQRVDACLPAFPFKSANKVYKVLGSLPDKAEELALHRLNSMCAKIKQIYKPGARVTIVSDGITYNGTYDVSFFLRDT